MVGPKSPEETKSTDSVAPSSRGASILVAVSSSQHSAATRWWPLVPGLLLALVASHQVFLSQTAQMNPWKGGGFGMFATTDHGSARRVRAWRIADGMRQRVSIPDSLAGHALDVRQLPRQRDLDGFARDLHERVQPSGPILVEVIRIRIHLPDLPDLAEAKREESVLVSAHWPPASEDQRR